MVRIAIKLNRQQREVADILCTGKQKSEILKILNISRSTYYRILNQLRGICKVARNNELLPFLLGCNSVAN